MEDEQTLREGGQKLGSLAWQMGAGDGRVPCFFLAFGGSRRLASKEEGG